MKGKTYNRWISWFLLLLTPAFCYCIFECITRNLFLIQGEFLIWNLLFYYTIYFFLFGITGRMRLAYLPLNVVFTILAIAEFYVVDFRARPIMIWDIMAWRTAATVAGHYSYRFSLKLTAAAVLMLIWSFLIWKFPVPLPKGKKRAAFAVTSIAWTVWWNAYFFQVVVPVKSIDVSMWNPVETYETQGYLLCTMRIFAYLNMEKPPGYQHHTVAQMYDELEEIIPDEGDVPLNIICIMNESWSDLSVIAPFETNLPYSSYYDSLVENCAKGYVYVPVFGSMTSNTEYEFLTGNSMAFAPVGSVPFQIYMKDHTWSMVDTMKEQGYYTIAMHPYPADNWNRTVAYNSLGFDEFLDEEFYVDSPTLRGYVSDEGCYEKIIEMTELNEEKQPLFFFLVTMQNHGGYSLSYEPAVQLTEYEEFTETEQYLSLIRETDQALEYLIEYYSRSDQPTLIMMFGDHQPGIEKEFYEELYGGSLSSLNTEDYLRRYATPYFIWTNYENKLEEPGDFSVLYLSNQVLKAANLPLNGYQSFLEKLKSQVPLIHDLGYYDDEGIWESWTNWRTKESYSWLQLLEWFQYYRMFDRKIGGPQ